jgi:hypothetical protein
MRGRAAHQRGTCLLIPLGFVVSMVVLFVLAGLLGLRVDEAGPLAAATFAPFLLVAVWRFVCSA